MNKIFLIPAVLESYRSLKDRTLKLSFETSEPTPEQLTNIALSIQNSGYLAFNTDVFKTEQLQAIQDIKTDYDDKEKSHSQRLKSVLYVAWKQDNEGYSDSELYYRFKMEKFINHIKSKLT